MARHCACWTRWKQRSLSRSPRMTPGSSADAQCRLTSVSWTTESRVAVSTCASAWKRPAPGRARAADAGRSAPRDSPTAPAAARCRSRKPALAELLDAQASRADAERRQQAILRGPCARARRAARRQRGARPRHAPQRTGSAPSRCLPRLGMPGHCRGGKHGEGRQQAGRFRDGLELGRGQQAQALPHARRQAKGGAPADAIGTEQLEELPIEVVDFAAELAYRAICSSFARFPGRPAAVL